MSTPKTIGYRDERSKRSPWVSMLVPLRRHTRPHEEIGKQRIPCRSTRQAMATVSRDEWIPPTWTTMMPCDG